MIKRGSLTLSIGSSGCFLLECMKCLFSNKKCKRTLSEKVILLKLNFELTTGWQIVVQFSVQVIIVANVYRLSDTRYDSSNNLEIK